MLCLKCGCEESKVVDSRNVVETNAIRRRRECLNCKNRFTTYEKIEYTPVMVIKKNGAREEFERDKIITGMLRACEKRPVSREDIERAVNEMELELTSTANKEIESQKIGEMVIEKLRKLDEIAYVRFASVYRQFKDINEFKQELNKLLK